MKYLRLILIIAVIAASLAYLKFHVSRNAQSQVSQSSTAESFPTDEASSLWVVVNKGRILPAGYVPANLVTPSAAVASNTTIDEPMLRADTAKAMEVMFAAAAKDNISLMITSGYRSYNTQTTVYNYYVNSDGQAAADTVSARPGHSEHQTGLAADIEPASSNCELQICFDATPEGKWLAANSYKYGFVIRYQKDKEDLTGYSYEPWHVRYVGTDLALKLTRANQTLEQYFNLPIFTDYSAKPLALK